MSACADGIKSVGDSGGSCWRTAINSYSTVTLALVARVHLNVRPTVTGVRPDVRCRLAPPSDHTLLAQHPEILVAEIEHLAQNGIGVLAADGRGEAVIDRGLGKLDRAANQVDKAGGGGRIGHADLHAPMQHLPIGKDLGDIV